MRPRTGIERMLLNEPFAPLPQKTMDWARRNLFMPSGVTWIQGRGRGRVRVVWCMECGRMETVPAVLATDPAMSGGWECPSCHSLITTHNEPKAVKIQSDTRLMSILEVRGEWQVFRCFDMRRVRTAGGNMERTAVELFRIFVNGKGTEHIVARQYTRGYNYLHWGEGWMIARHNGHITGYYAYEDMYDLKGVPIAPGGRIHPELRMRGLDVRILRNPKYDPASLARCVARFPQAETLLKSGQVTLLEDVINHGKHSGVIRHWSSVKIALHHGYGLHKANLTMWLDHLDGLVREGKDVRNPHHICPADLRHEHDRQIQREQARRKVIDRQALDAADKELRKRIAAIMDVVVTEGDISIRPLRSVEEFREEGKALHHCVFANKYYSKPGSIILGASVRGERAETVELNAHSLEILQCRGDHNGDSPYHDKIMKLLKANVQYFNLANK